MNRRLFGLALAAMMIIASCQKTPDLDPIQPDLKKAQVEESDYRVIPGQYIVVLNEFPGQPKGKAAGYEAGIANARQAAQGLLNENRIQANKIGRVYAFALDGFSATLTEEEMIRLARDKRVKYIEPDQIISISGSQSNATWGIDRVDQRDRPLNQTYTWDATGSGVRAYIIDTGILLTHNEFGGRASFGFDAFGGNGTDGNGHGTHVAGTVGGTIYGVAKNVLLIAIRVLDNSGSGSTSGVIAGMDWVAANHIKPAVANMSLGGGASTSIDDAVARMYDAGVPVIVAAGNGNMAGREQPACNYSPARAPKAYTVGATTSSDAKASYSNYGDCVNIFAPGSSITSAWHTSNTATNTISGTSMASPHVAGGAALFLEKNPGATAQQVYDAITSNSTKNKVTSSKTTNNHLLYTLGFGGDGGGETDTHAPSQVTGLTATAVSSSQINLSWNAATDNVGVTGYKIYRNNSLISTVSGTTFNNSGLNSSTNYTYEVSAVDAAGNEGSRSTSVSATTLSSGGGITLSAVGYKVQGRQRVDLTWTGATSVDIYRDGVKIVTTSGSTYTDNINKVGGGSYSYQVCSAVSSTCSNTVTVTF